MAERKNTGIAVHDAKRLESGWEHATIRWTNLDPSSLAKAEQLACEAEADEWWNWPQAVAWVGGRDLKDIATMRLCAEPWKNRDDYRPDVALGAEHYLAQTYCVHAPAAEDDLQRAIERGAIRTLGRHTVDSPSRELKPLDWRGGIVVYNRTATLVSETNMLSEWACDVGVNRADLWVAFPAVADTCEPATIGNFTIGAESECREWLAREFNSDPDKRSSKEQFRTAALSRFGDRLSASGFNRRVWPALAQEHGRQTAGAKKKS